MTAVGHQALLVLEEGKEMFRLFWRNHLSLARWLLNNATLLSANELDAVRNVRSKLERDRTKPSPGQKKWLKALYERERKGRRRWP